MRIAKFDISNFKGVEHTTVHLADQAPGNICTLIGLNESGKTTILEALSSFVTKDRDTASLVGTVLEQSSKQDLIPKHKKSAFTGSVSVKATVLLDEYDVEALANMFKSQHMLILDHTSVPKQITVDRVDIFEDSTYKE